MADRIKAWDLEGEFNRLPSKVRLATAVRIEEMILARLQGLDTDKVYTVEELDQWMKRLRNTCTWRARTDAVLKAEREREANRVTAARVRDWINSVGMAATVDLLDRISTEQWRGLCVELGLDANVAGCLDAMDAAVKAGRK